MTQSETRDMGGSVDLTEWTTCGGCAAKWGAGPLDALLATLASQSADSSLLVGLDAFDGEAFRAEPVGEMLGFGPDVPDQLAGRLDGAGEPHRLYRHWFWGGRRHIHFPALLVLTSNFGLSFESSSSRRS